jgi:hypothetical protein
VSRWLSELQASIAALLAPGRSAVLGGGRHKEVLSVFSPSRPGRKVVRNVCFSGLDDLGAFFSGVDSEGAEATGFREGEVDVLSSGRDGEDLACADARLCMAGRDSSV